MMFNAQLALETSSSSTRVEASGDQHRLNIEEKTRTSVLPWRGQFSPQLIEFLIDKYAPSNGLIVDPFCGSGTVLYEAAAHNRDSSGFDINPAAVALSKAAYLCGVPLKGRAGVLEEIERLSARLLKLIEQENSLLEADNAAGLFQADANSFELPEIMFAYLLQVFGDKRAVSPKEVQKATNSIRKLIYSVPHSACTVEARVGDARHLPLRDGAASYIVTSPPYINVFNYHQNYRPIIEALGATPLASARAEIGANRKFRMNRFITVVQYCIDISLFFSEAARILDSKGLITIILGRESNVRGVPFKNGELVAAIVSDGLGGQIIDWNERKFLNRFGIEIYEDVLTIRPKWKPEEISIEVGRSIGLEGLRNSLSYAPEDRKEEIHLAIEAGRKVDCSPNILEDAT